MEQEKDRAEELFPEQGFYCGEAVLYAVARARGLDSECVPRMATGFCSGMARTDGPCGALMGAILAVNLLTGRDQPERTEESQAELADCYARVQQVVRGFESRFGSKNCSRITGCDLSTDEGRQAFSDQGKIRQCKEFVRVAAELALEATEDM